MPAIGVALDNHRIAGRDQRAVDQIEGLQRSGYQQNVVGRAGDAGVAVQFGSEKIAQRLVALRAVAHAIIGEASTLAPEHRIGGR